MWKVKSHGMGKVWENINIPKLLVSYICRNKQKSILFPNHWKNDCHSNGKIWKNKNIPKLWVS